jgi:hypothetical protein
MIRVTVTGSFKRTEDFLASMLRGDQVRDLKRFGEQGVAALQAATPRDRGETAAAWYFEIEQRRGYFAIHWYNSHVEDGVPIAVILQYGHATRNGGHVEGVDYINPAMKPIFDQMATEMWKVVTR